MSGHIVASLFEFPGCLQVVDHHLCESICDAAVGAISKPVRVNVQRDRRTRVTEAVLQIGDRDPAFDFTRPL